MPLEDGSNAEREDLATPLPSWTRAELTDVVLYGTHASPATAKARAVLDLAGVAYARRFGKVGHSSYQKFPVAFVNGRQINDSHVICKSLAPVLFGAPLTEADLRVDEVTTYGLMLACEVKAFSSPDCMRRWAALAGLAGGVTGFLVRHLAPFSLAQRAADGLREKHPHLKEPAEYCRDLRQELDERASPFFAGQQPGAVDASLFGALAVWAAGGEYSMPFATEAIEQGGLQPWHERMTAAMPDLFEKHGWWPFYT
mmetsp:Transcript_72417/g.204710  ORF Transcript_72417/g.204710 Transcript_72417/m.204710 type:complete len:256 (-) Transcript_72417:79-846(-)